MAKSKVAATPAVNDGRAEYRVAKDIKMVNGAKVTGPTVSLTKAQALYDLALGRITPVVATNATPEVAADGRD